MNVVHKIIYASFVLPSSLYMYMFARGQSSVELRWKRSRLKWINNSCNCFFYVERNSIWTCDNWLLAQHAQKWQWIQFQIDDNLSIEKIELFLESTLNYNESCGIYGRWLCTMRLCLGYIIQKISEQWRFIEKVSSILEIVLDASSTGRYVYISWGKHLAK